MNTLRQPHNDASLRERFNCQRFNILYGAEFPGTDIVTKLQLIAKKLLSENRGDELNHLIRNFQFGQKFHLFESVQGLVANDGGRYVFSRYTEWQVLQDADFKVRADGRLGFSVTDNSAFNRIYAGSYHRPEFAQEMKLMLCDQLKLGLEPGTDFYKEIVFDEATSNRLIAAGLHLGPKLLENMLLPKAELATGVSVSSSPAAMFSSSGNAPIPAAESSMEKVPASPRR